MSTRPPLTAIFVFCTVVRCGSFKAAAQALCVTPGAVSRQIQVLEAYLDQALFKRSPGGIRLTRKGEELQARVADKMNSIGAEVEQMRVGARKAVVKVDVGVTLAMYWLIPRLASFTQKHAGVQVQVGTSDGAVDMSRRVDLHIRRDPADFRGMKSEWLFDEHSVLVASPQFAATDTGAIEQLADCTRIGARSRPELWSQWSTRHHLDPACFGPTLEFDNTVLAIQAAVEGLGALVVPEMFVAHLLDQRLLVLLNPVRVRTGSYAYVVRVRRESVVRFTDWLRQLC